MKMNCLLLIYFLPGISVLSYSQNSSTAAKVVASSVKTNEAVTYSITGNLKGLKDNTLIYLKKSRHNSPVKDTVASTRSKGELFKFNGQLAPAEEGNAYSISIDANDNRYQNQKNKNIVFHLENSAVKIKGIVDSFSQKQLSIEGSQVNADLAALNAAIEANVTTPLNKFVSPAYNRFIAKQKSDTSAASKQLLQGAAALMAHFAEEKNALTLKWIEEHPNSLIAPSLVLPMYKNTAAENERLYNMFSDRVKNSYYGKKMKEELDVLASISVGRTIPAVTFKDTAGNALSLHKIAANNKITIVDFWAYWCGPCRASFPKIKELYSQYGDKGLAVYAVSTDTAHNKWVEAINQDQLPWHNVVVDEPGMAAKLFAIKAIPTGFLIDKDGKILAHWIGSNKELEALIKQHLKL